MNRNSLLEMSGRVMHIAQRFTLNQSNDNPLMQELHLDGMMGEVRGAVERIQHFGFTSTPLPRDEAQQGASGGIGGAVSGAISSAVSGAVGGLLNSIKGPAAEGICLMIGGQRNHPVCIAIDDRRHRPMGLKPGENAQYDDLGQMTLLRRTGLFLLSSDDVQPKQSGGGAGSARDSSSGSQQVARMASLRHVQKQPQQRPGSKPAGSGAAVSALAQAAGATASQSPQNYKHEGDTVNTEVRVTKTDIQILDGETVVGRYDKASGTWTFTSKSITLHASSAMTVQCDARLDIKGKPIVFNNGTPSTPPFQVPGS